jgi:phage FluMu protein Com
MASIIVKCDRCGAQLDTKVEGEHEARYIAKQAGWHSEGGITADANTRDYCPRCKDAQAASSTEAQ